MELSGIESKVALITGAAQGIGAEVAHTLALAGAHVALADTNAERLTTAVAKIEAAGLSASGHPVDVRDSDAVEALAQQVEAEHGPIDILVNAAGVLRTGRAVDLADQHWNEVFAVNATGVFHVSRAVARRMLSRRRGAIVTVASNAGGVPRVDMAAYAASKAASAHFTRCLGLELAPSGIRCNVVSPGSTDTPMLRSMLGELTDPAILITGSAEAYKIAIPLGKLAQPSDVAAAVAFLVSDQAGHITMHDMYIDGGAALHV
ncbi:2,3-dihydro-2,3-dihydroxybenzoate dehydrogenase [Actinoplanes xinjiangensis]|uniref:2,3-dihydro-2,3-dihydroxybenzoate dehydrogenase n=1 Tax=Actinoplanes xinjiangensis TaxID=512350 RepID=A0A316EVL3_9ACTN|nr:2,3-dihydro-2,3-dihydroxybenzoate dehydrogenase [Actinoplanes xinjiangensis]PWK36052.1 2,3-dihydro-2,3-dihydroxybenzoate dehydrogenase [Actinoplanes xinjiangensis]GIF42946.1 2,3-dihydro-2,3-dihydroxybenzoate dehydrogenase [Actinoplanes xinjiangensis]